MVNVFLTIRAESLIFIPKRDPAMIRIEFSDSAKAALSYERFNHPHPFVQRKMEALWLKSQGLPHQQF